MSASWDWPGSRWWRVDLHTHSAASLDFKPDTARAAKDWPAWVAAAKAAGLHAVALTDHNTPEGITEIQAAATAANGLAIFPGVELTVGGIHLLCIFDPARSRDDVVALLGSLGIAPATFGRHDAASPNSITEVIEVATKMGAVVIAAHANGPKGLLGRLDGQERLKVLGHLALAAVELADVPAVPDDPAEWRDPLGAEVQRWLDGSRTAGVKLTQVWSSDGHGHAAFGRCFTWFKMSRPDIEGLRLALLDGIGSVLPKRAIHDPNAHASSVLESITVTKAKYLGRSAPLTVTFNPWLNAIIGGRGTGKSTLVDLARATLRREAELNTDGPLKASYERRMSVPASRAEEGVLTGDTVVEIVYRKDGERFLLSWDPAGRSGAIARLEGDRRVAEEGRVRDRFPVRIYGQKQLFELAKQPNALLSVIDDSTAVGGGDLTRSRAEAEASFLALCAEARSLRAQAAELPARRAALEDVRRKIDVLQKGGHAQALNDFRQRRRQNSTWTSIRDAAGDGIRRLREASEGLVVADLDLGDPDPEVEGLKRAHERARKVVEELRATVNGAVAAAQARLTALQDSEDLAAWRDVVAKSEAAYAEVSARLADAGIANPDQYRDLLQRSTQLEAEITSLRERELRAQAREEEALAARDRFRALRGQLTSRRTEFARATSNDLIKVEVQGCGDREELDRFLHETLGIRAFEEDYKALRDLIEPPVGPLLQGIPSASAWTYDDLDKVVVQLRAVIAEPQKVWPAKDRRFDSALRKVPPERLDRLTLYTPEDAVDVSFYDPRAERWKKLSQGSPGQQTAALLAFVLGYGDEPIIMDQPEDDLDNTLIYELLVRRLRDAKSTRQIVVVTHNPNIVVHGDAELVVSLENEKGQTRIAFSGGLQEQRARDEICRVMEGGRDAFENRYRRIMHGGAKAPREPGAEAKGAPSDG